MRRVLFLAWAEVLHVLRDRATMAQIFVVPVVQLLVPQSEPLLLRTEALLEVAGHEDQRVDQAGRNRAVVVGSGPNGLAGAVVTYQWQQRGATFTNIAGATAQTFTPLQAQVGRRVRALRSRRSARWCRRPLHPRATG